MARGHPRKNAVGEVVTRRGGAAPPPQLRFSAKLILNHWLLSLFRVRDFEALAEPLREERHEGLDENNVHHFHHILAAHFPNLPSLPPALLLEYDQNIVRHTQRLNERRLGRGEQRIVWKYFQYLTLLFTEIYLDHYFRDADALRSTLNKQIVSFNDRTPTADQIAPLDATVEAWTQLNKLSYWMATGSGKTLLMHANILQYQFYLEKHGRRRELNRILLLTPNEGLSQQHLREFDAAGIEAELFNKDGSGLFAGRAVEIIEITRLRDEMGEKTIAIDAFEGNNLVLVDEGHRGASGGSDGAWMRFRNQLSEGGFSFEYSATFGQAVKSKPELIQHYARNILVDYSYRYFYGDGFGKDYQILNLSAQTEQSYLDLYLVAALLSFYQQQRLYREHGASFRPFNIEKPLWVFVGGSVTATLAKQDASDIVAILKFIARYVADRRGSIQRIERVLSQGLVTSSGRDLFYGRFSALMESGLSAEQIFDDTLAILFNAPAGGQLYVENLKGVTGEIALRLGADNEPFGVINVGSDTKLISLCEDEGIETGEREFSDSLFHEINRSTSTVNVLIGSRKFTEGWSSWRVSTMGLMNIGKGEGAQIIQLFGRGVRLKGYEMSLKRSARTTLSEGVARPKHIDALETLGIFGIRADYMAQFRDFLAEEGLPTNEERVEFWLPVIKNLGRQRLKTIGIRKQINGIKTEGGEAFRRLAPVPTLVPPNPHRQTNDDYLLKNRVIVDWYPKIGAIESRDPERWGGIAGKNESQLTEQHIAFLDLDRLYFELERFRAERGWHNLNLTRDAIRELLADRRWYRLMIPAAEMEFDSIAKVAMWQEIAAALLKKYTERYYTFRRNEWERPHLEYRILDEDDPNLQGVREGPKDAYYRILVHQSTGDIVRKLEELKAAIEAEELKAFTFDGLTALMFDRHLYKPLLYLDRQIVEISPAPLNRGERRFVDDLRRFYDAHPDFFQSQELYLLRNQSRGRGIGFFEAGNFHPDFILWLVSGERQRVIFVDPKGVRNIPWDDPKIRFSQTVKEIEERLGDPQVTLDSFIVSNTPLHEMEAMWRVSETEMRERHVLFPADDNAYIGEILGAL